MKRRSKSLWRVVSIRCLAVVLVITGITCHGLSLGRRPLFARPVGLNRGSKSMRFEFSREGPHLRNKHRFRKGRNGHKEGSKLYGYLDSMDRQSGKNYDMWRRKKMTNETVLVDKVQNAFESTPAPFGNFVSQEYW